MISQKRKITHVFPHQLMKYDKSRV